MKRFKLILSAIQAGILAVCLSFTASAWFSFNKQVKSSDVGMTIQSVSDVTTLSAYALRYDGTFGAICYKIGDGEGEVTNVEMTEFDRIFQDRSVNTPLIYAIELSNVPDTQGYYISVKIPCSEKFLRVGNETTNVLTNDGSANFVIQRFISNVVSLKAKCGGKLDSRLIPTTTRREQNNVAVFQEQSAAFRNLTTGEAVGRYATVLNETEYSKVEYVQLRIYQSDYHSSIYQEENELGVLENRLMLYIQFDYDKDLMNEFIQHMMDDSEGDVSFEDDFGVIQILVGTGGN